jgi:hypothetical protein
LRLKTIVKNEKNVRLLCSLKKLSGKTNDLDGKPYEKNARGVARPVVRKGKIQAVCPLNEAVCPFRIMDDGIEIKTFQGASAT